MNMEMNAPEEIIIKLKKLIKVLEQCQRDMSDCDITPAQARVIFPIIKQGHGCTMQEIVELVNVDKGYVSRVVADLELKGFVERDKKADSNEKNYKIVLSEKGQKLFSEKFEQKKVQIEKWREKFTDAELQNFIKVLDKLTE